MDMMKRCGWEERRLWPYCADTGFDAEERAFLKDYILTVWLTYSLFLPFPFVISITTSHRSKPLQIWDKKVRNGHIKRITDPDIQSSVLEIMGTNVSTTYIQCPADPKKTLGIKLPFLVMIIKNVSIPHSLSSQPYKPNHLHILLDCMLKTH